MAPAADVDELKATNVILMQYSTPMDGGTLHGSPMVRLPRLLHHDATVNHDTSDESSQWEIKKLDAELAGLKAMLNQIAARVTLLKRRRNSLSPVLRLPQEILAEIFLVAFPYNRRECWAAETPLLLGKVCSAWRAISWSTPQLWCTLWWRHSTVVTGYQHYSGTKIALLREWLARTGSMPLALSVVLTGGHSSMYEILDILARSAAQWKDINFSFSRCFTEGRCFVPTQFPLLESLTVDMVRQGYGYKHSATFFDAPRLRTVHLRGFSRPSLVLLPLDQHLDISLMQVSARDCLEVLNANPNTASLVVYSLCESRHQAGGPARFPQIVARHLRSLTLQTGEDTIATLLQQLVAPVLRTLNITLDLEQNFPWTFLASFISRSNCSMSFEHFSLDFEKITGGLLTQLLLTMPSLVTLELAAEKLDPPVFRHIIQRHQSDALVPNLEHFVFRGEDLFGLWEFLIVLKSRWYIPSLDGQALDLPTRLRSVRVEVAPGRNAKAELESSAIRSGFQKLQAEGMVIKLVISGKAVELGPMSETVL